MSVIRAGALTALEKAARAVDSLRPNSPRATFLHQGQAATRYWRVSMPAKYLPAREVNALRFQSREYAHKIVFPQLRGNTAVFQYPGDNGHAIYLMAIQSQGNRVFVETDDNYIDHGDELWMKRAQWGQSIGDSPNTNEGHRWIVENADGVIVTTRALAEVYGEANANVHVCRNSIDPADWPEPAPRDGVFRIGWYASDSHDRDAPLVAKALSWASRQPNVEVVNIGHDPGWPFRRTQVPWTPQFLSQREHLCRLDVGVAPLVASPLARYRSDLKALEYAMGGAMPLLQAAEPYWEWEHLPFIDWCVTQGDWMRAIKWVVENQDGARSMAQHARNYVLEHRTIGVEIDRWRDAIEGGG